ncbi:helix-turn-helix domain-containing protein [Solilutibacter silvestris]|uniref:Helix-turn-helix protein n=1 Tax=Solilutibacter silvestris TaxID=1645665 RepID=A0A2K1Q449_9GAMM|nr:helix-turn-helix domain-containing protein [Lysobacter silvestris]PNS09818.1 helix-turn-helix protein [Lysobacter silvestris]
MIRLTTTQLDEFESALCGVDGHYVVTNCTDHEWRLRVVDLDAIQIMLVQFGSDCVFRGAFSPGRFGLALPLSKGGCFALNGTSLSNETFAWLAPEQEYHGIRYGGVRTLAISIDAQRVPYLRAVYPQLFDTPSNAIINASPDAIPRLLVLLRSILHVDTVEPQALQDPLIRESLCQQLLESIRVLLEAAQPAAPADLGRPRADREEIIRRTMNIIDQRIDEPIHVGDLCEAAQVSERTLHAAYSQCLGVSPHRYLMLHRLRAVHSAIRRARPADTVASICAKYGVWDFGRFSAQYRRVFGTLPSMTLAKARA